MLRLRAALAVLHAGCFRTLSWLGEAKEDGACSAEGGSCDTDQWWAEPGQELSSPYLLHVDTFNFNSTVARTADRPLLIAFYDPRSQSYKDLKPELELTARELSRHESSGAPIGWLGACDVAVNTFLGQQEAPEISEGWQEFSKQAFRFRRPRFFPLIIMVFDRGQRAGEYVGVVSAKHITAFLQRCSSVRGGELLPDVGALRLLLQRPGPYALGCGLEAGSDEQKAFNSTAHELHGQLIFGLAPKRVCEEALGPLPAHWPQVAWVDSSSMSRVKSLAGAALGAGNLSEWLRSQRPELLEEMTPDTSHKHLDRPEPLLVFLVDPSDQASWRRGESIVASIENKLINNIQLVWSDCLVFGDQFEATDACPVFVLVHTETLQWIKKPLKSLEDSGKELNASMRLLLWLEENTGIPLRDSKAQKEARPQPAAANHTNSSHKADDETKKVPEEPEDDFTRTMPVLDASAELAAVWACYQSALRQMLQLQISYQARFGHLKFDFGDLKKAQQLHRSMRSLASGPASLQRQVQDPARLAKLWRAIEWLASFERNVSLDKSRHEKVLAQKLHEGYRLVRNLFVRLFRHLHGHASAGTLGIPEAKEQPLERRSAAELSVKEFIEDYAKPGRPLIITGLNITEEEPWTLDFFRRRCNVTAGFHRRNAKKKSWGRLEHAGHLPLADFLDSFTSNATRRHWYLHDWSLPNHCPQVFGPAPYSGFTVPKYFAGDYFQRAAFQGYQHSWPSLFVGSEETQSAMHIDSGGTNFWLYLLSGRKEWRFFSRRDLVNVYQSPLREHFLVDVFQPDLEKFPLVRYAELFAGVQEPGELMFIPGGNPHAVRNLEPIHGVSMNYADASNVWIYLWHQLAEGSWESFEMFTDGTTFPHGLRSEQQPIRFGEWKSTRWQDLTYDLQ